MACDTPSKSSTANQSPQLRINNLIHLRRSLNLSRANQTPHSRRHHTYSHSHPRLHSHNRYNRKRNLAGRLSLGPVLLYPPRAYHLRYLLPPKSSRRWSLSMQRAHHRPQVRKLRGFTLVVLVPVLCRVRVHPKRANTSGDFQSTKWASERSLAHPLPRRLRIPQLKLRVLHQKARRQRSTRLFLKSRDRLLAGPRRCRSHRHPRVARQSRLPPRRPPYLVQTTARRIVAAR